MDHPTAHLASVAAATIQDLKHYLTDITADHYRQPLDVLSGSSVGQHTRHVIEFYQCLVEQSSSVPATINYAARRRDILIESDPAYALQLIETLSKRFAELEELSPCLVACDEHHEGNATVTSTIGRELLYNIEHAIHHLAIIRIALKHIDQVFELPEHFGIAPSTIRHRLEACAR